VQLAHCVAGLTPLFSSAVYRVLVFLTLSALHQCTHERLLQLVALRYVVSLLHQANKHNTAIHSATHTLNRSLLVVLVAVVCCEEALWAEHGIYLQLKCVKTVLTILAAVAAVITQQCY
jgi:hypothetical protein